MFDNSHFPRAKKYWYMGKFYDWAETNIHAMSHALHYGTSVFEGIRAYKTSKGPAVFRLQDHIDRFFYSASLLKMNVPYTPQEIKETIKPNPDARDAYEANYQIFRELYTSTKHLMHRL